MHQLESHALTPTERLWPGEHSLCLWLRCSGSLDCCALSRCGAACRSECQHIHVAAGGAAVLLAGGHGWIV